MNKERAAAATTTTTTEEDELHGPEASACLVLDNHVLRFSFQWAEGMVDCNDTWFGFAWFTERDTLIGYFISRAPCVKSAFPIVDNRNNTSDTELFHSPIDHYDVHIL